jgi:hypothetical protein
MDEGPPGPVAGEPWIWLSATTVSSDGAQLASAVANTTEAPILYGVLGIFEHWSDGRWARAGSWLTSLDHWGGFPEIVPDGRQVVVPAIGLHASGNGLGPVEYFSLPPLAEGWYRVGHSAGVSAAYAVIEVVQGTAPKLLPIDNPHPPTLLANPTLMRHSGELRITALPPSGGVITRDDVLRFNRELAPSVALYHWNGQSWAFMTMLAVDDSQPQKGYAGESIITLPELSTGAYRIVRQSASEGLLARVLWVDGWPVWWPTPGSRVVRPTWATSSRPPRWRLTPSLAADRRETRSGSPRRPHARVKSEPLL